MARRSKHSREEIKEMALRAAEEIVDREGYSGLSTRKVAKAIGYAVGTLYLVFKNLDDLILHINGRTLDLLFEDLERAVAPCPDAQPGMLALGHAYIDFASAHTLRWSLLYEHKLQEGQEVPRWFQDKITRIFHLLEQTLTPLAGRHWQDEIELAARALWSGVHGICVLSFTNALDLAGARSMHALSDSLIRNYLTGFVHNMDAVKNPGESL